MHFYPSTVFYRIDCLPNKLQITDFSFVRSGAVVADGLAKNLRAFGPQIFCSYLFFLRGRRIRSVVAKRSKNGPKMIQNGAQTIQRKTLS